MTFFGQNIVFNYFIRNVIRVSVYKIFEVYEEKQIDGKR